MLTGKSPERRRSLPALRLTAAALAALVLVVAPGCGSTAHRDSFNVRSHHLKGPPTVRIAGSTIVFRIPQSWVVPDTVVRPVFERTGFEILLRARYDMFEYPREDWAFELADWGYEPGDYDELRVLWVEPDGSRLELPIQR